MSLPVAVSFAEVSGCRVFDGVGHTDAVRLLDRGEFATGRCGRECGEGSCHLGTRDVVDADGEQRDASALIAESEIDTLLCHGDGANLSVDYHLLRQ